MINTREILQTIKMIDQQHLDIRTITMGISLRDCARQDKNACCDAIYDKITRSAEHLVKTGEDIEREFGIPIVNKRISVTPIAIACEPCQTTDYAAFARTLDKAAATVGDEKSAAYRKERDEARLQALRQTRRVGAKQNVSTRRFLRKINVT